jgi:hypothetical protein
MEVLDYAHAIANSLSAWRVNPSQLLVRERRQRNLGLVSGAYDQLLLAPFPTVEGTVFIADHTNRRRT